MTWAWELSIQPRYSQGSCLLPVPIWDLFHGLQLHRRSRPSSHFLGASGVILLSSQIMLNFKVPRPSKPLQFRHHLQGMAELALAHLGTSPVNRVSIPCTLPEKTRTSLAVALRLCFLCTAPPQARALASGRCEQAGFPVCQQPALPELQPSAPLLLGQERAPAQCPSLLRPIQFPECHFFFFFFLLLKALPTTPSCLTCKTPLNISRLPVRTALFACCVSRSTASLSLSSHRWN